MTSPRVLLFGTHDDQRSPRPRVLREGIEAQGYRMEECVVPLGMSSDLRVLIFRRPWLLPLFAAKLVLTWGRLLARSTRHRRPDIVLVGYMAQLDVLLARLRYPRATIVMDYLVSLSGTGKDRGAPSGVFGRVLALADDAALRCSDVVVVDTDEHLVDLPECHRSKGVVVLVGATAATFAGRPAHLAATPPLRVVFCGRYIPLQGTPTIGTAIGALHDRGRDDIEFTMIGRGQDMAACRANAGVAANVTWIDRMVEREELVELMAGHQVALGVFGTTVKSSKVVPTKVFDAMAMGQAVVTADTAPQRRVLRAGATFVEAGDAAALADALERLADGGDAGLLAHDAAALADAEFTPQRVVVPLIERLRERPPTPVLPPLSLNAWHRWDVVEATLEAHRPTTILELGAGRGAMGARLASNASYVGVEPDDASRADAVRVLACVAPTASMHPSLADVDPSMRFDLVCAFEVLEHIDDDRAALVESADRISPGGALLLSVPAHRRRYGAADARVGHFRRYDGDDVERLVHDAGLRLERLWSTGWPVGLGLEAAWNVATRARPSGASTSERTAESGRWLQPRRAVGTAWRVASTPGRRLQRLRFDSDAGTGWVGLCRR